MMSPNLEPPPSSSSPDHRMSSSSMTVTGRASCDAQTEDLLPQPTIDHPLQAEGSRPTMQQVMDLKLHLAECLAENDTLKHRNSVLTKQNNELIRDRSDLAVDLERAYAQITKLKKERDEAVRDFTRAQMLQIRQDSRKAKLLLDGGNSSANTQPGSSGSLNVSNSGPNAPKNDSKGRGWLGRLSVNFKNASSSNGQHDSFSSTASSSIDIAAVDPKTHHPSSAGAGTMLSISKSTLNLFNGSTLSFLTSDLGSEALGGAGGGGDPHSNALSSLERNDVLPGRRSSITVASTATFDSHNGGSLSGAAGTSHGRHARRNTDRDVRGFLSRLSLSSDASLFGGETDSEEEFEDYMYLVQNDRREDHKVEGAALRNKEQMAVDAVHKTSDGASSASLALDTCRLPKRLSLNAREA